MLCRAGSDIQGPADLAGRRIGVRAYSQTTGMWLRGIVAEHGGPPPSASRWITFEDAHVQGIADPPWAASAVSIARKYEAPVVPIHVAGPWSSLFHLFNRVSSELRDITLFHEMLNKRGRAFALTVGKPISPDLLGADPTETAARLKAFVERDLAQDPDRAFA